MSNATPGACPECGFVWEHINRENVIPGINDAVTSFIDVIEAAGDMATVRPSPERWSIVEYGGHLRDVLISIRERIIVASVVDKPTGMPIYRDERVNLGFYSLDSTDDVPDELGMAAGLISKTIATLPDGYETRPVIYSPVSNFETTIMWMAAQAMHECEHHLADVKKNLESAQ
jgi:hypothetical protein